MAVKLTEARVARLPAPDPSGKQKLHWDIDLKGFGVLCSGVTSSKTYVVQRGLPNGNTRRVTVAAVNAAAKLLEFGGVKPALARGAVAIMRDTHKLVIDETDGEPTVYAETEYGPRELSDVVEEFLASEAASPYMKGDGPQKQPAPHFASQLATKH